MVTGLTFCYCDVLELLADCADASTTHRAMDDDDK